MKFTLEIELGNDATLEAFDVAESLRQVAARLDNNTLTEDASATIRDKNGNTVGKWEVIEG